MSTVRDRIKPLVLNTIRAEGAPTYSAACFEGNDWSLAPLQRTGDQDKAPDLAHKLNDALLGLGASCAYAPSPVKFNGKIIRPTTLLQEQIPLGDVMLYRNQAVPADGTWLPDAGCAGIFSAGGCSMIVVTMGREMIFAHAGRDCVIDRKRIMTRDRERGRHNESVVNSIVDSLAPSDWLRSQLRVAVYYSIKPEDFRHDFADVDPEHLKYNTEAARKLLYEYGDECGTVDTRGICIDIPRIIRAQFISLGVPAANISLEHAYLADELPTTRRGGGRYLAAVVRHT